jgi:hypothetical protein
MALRATEIHEDAARLVGRAPSPARSPLARLPASGTGASRADQGVRPTTARLQGSGFGAPPNAGRYVSATADANANVTLVLVTSPWLVMRPPEPSRFTIFPMGNW